MDRARLAARRGALRDERRLASPGDGLRHVRARSGRRVATLRCLALREVLLGRAGKRARRAHPDARRGRAERAHLVIAGELDPNPARLPDDSYVRSGPTASRALRTPPSRVPGPRLL